jgi:hypothetical protein
MTFSVGRLYNVDESCAKIVEVCYFSILIQLLILRILRKQSVQVRGGM